MATQALILAAGMGTRLGRPLPKPLTELQPGHSILQQQIENLRVALPDVGISVVVGFKRDLIMETVPDVMFVYNEAYDQTNTSMSLLKALRLSGRGGALWLNGDVVFDPEVLHRAKLLIADDQSFVCVNTADVGEEEVKYTLDRDGSVLELSKRPAGAARGEAVGINYVAATDKPALIDSLADVADDDYFERGMELAIQNGLIKFHPLDISDLAVVEVDFQHDLDRARAIFQGEATDTNAASRTGESGS